MSTDPPTEDTPQPGTPGRPDGFDLGVFARERRDSPPAPSRRRVGRPGPTPGPYILVSVVAAVVALIAVLVIVGSDSNGDTAAVPLTLATTTTAAPSTTVAAATTVPVTTTVATTTTTVPATTTTTLAPIEPVGSPIAIDDLTLGAFGIGSLTLGDPGDVALGRLTASLGQPDEAEGDVVSDGQYGTCPGDQIGVYWWGPLGVITRTASDGDIFYSYRLDGRRGDPQDAAGGLKTLSGLGLGDTVGRATNIYSGAFTVDVIDHPVEGPAYEIREEGVLLWGPVNSADGTIQGIFTADPCGGALSG